MALSLNTERLNLYNSTVRSVILEWWQMYQPVSFRQISAFTADVGYMLNSRGVSTTEDDLKFMWGYLVVQP